MTRGAVTGVGAGVGEGFQHATDKADDDRPATAFDFAIFNSLVRVSS
jgi:hypothetical protein